LIEERRAAESLVPRPKSMLINPLWKVW
jgi:hypothetical protein